MAFAYLKRKGNTSEDVSEAEKKKAEDQLAGKIKLKELGLTDDQIAALID